MAPPCVRSIISSFSLRCTAILSVYMPIVIGITRTFHKAVPIGLIDSITRISYSKSLMELVYGSLRRTTMSTSSRGYLRTREGEGEAEGNVTVLSLAKASHEDPSRCSLRDSPPRSLILIKRNSASNKGRQASRIIRKGRYVLPGWSSRWMRVVAAREEGRRR